MDIKKKLEEVVESQKKAVEEIQKLDAQYNKVRSELMGSAIQLEGQIKLLKEMEQ